MAPFARLSSQKIVVPVAYGVFGAVYAHAFNALGLGVLRGSSGKDIYRSGGYRVLRQMLRALKQDTSVALTVDRPKIAKIVAPGVIALARHSGRPIIPLAAVTRRQITLRWRWDQATINLPFSPLVIATGAPIVILRMEDKSYYDEKRRELADALNALNSSATAIADC